MEIIRGRIQSAQKVVIYGPEGIGKSTFASCFPDPLFIDTEGSTKLMDVARMPAPQGAQDITDEINYVLNNPTVCKTIVIDTADWAEQRIIEAICKRAKKSGIEDFGYGKGYTYVAEGFQQLLRQLDKVIDAGIHVVITAHAKMRKFEQPDEMGAYDRWELKLSKQSAPLLKEWADMVLFANYKTYTVRTDDKKVKAQGGERTMYTSHHPCWDAKNRHGLNAEVPFSYDSIRHCIDPASDAPDAPSNTSNRASEPMFFYHPKTDKFWMVDAGDEIPADAHAQESVQIPEEKYRMHTQQKKRPAPERESMQDADQVALLPPERREPVIPAGTPDELAKLMRENHVDASEIQIVVHEKGYYPIDTPISAYDPEFIKAVLVGAWPQVFAAISENKNKTPF